MHQINKPYKIVAARRLSSENETESRHIQTRKRLSQTVRISKGTLPDEDIIMGEEEMINESANVSELHITEPANGAIH